MHNQYQCDPITTQFDTPSLISVTLLPEAAKLKFAAPAIVSVPLGVTVTAPALPLLTTTILPAPAVAAGRSTAAPPVVSVTRKSLAATAYGFAAVEFAFALTAVNTPVLGVVAPIGVLSILPLCTTAFGIVAASVPLPIVSPLPPLFSSLTLLIWLPFMVRLPLVTVTTPSPLTPNN